MSPTTQDQRSAHCRAVVQAARWQHIYLARVEKAVTAANRGDGAEVQRQWSRALDADATRQTWDELAALHHDRPELFEDVAS